MTEHGQTLQRLVVFVLVLTTVCMSQNLFGKIIDSTSESTIKEISSVKWTET